MLTDLTADDVLAMLTKVRRGLAADGYEVQVAIDDKISVRIVPGVDACADCLVTEQIMHQIVVSELRDVEDEIVGDDVLVLMPTHS